MGSKQSDPHTWGRPTFWPESDEDVKKIFDAQPNQIVEPPVTDEEVEKIFKDQPSEIVEPPKTEEEVEGLFEKKKHKGKTN